MAAGQSLSSHEWRADYGPSDRPLESFYIPALRRAVRYDRIAGFFSSYALAVAAQGIASLIARGGRMRLLAGAQLSEEDIAALLQGMELPDLLANKFEGVLTDPEALADHLVKRRLEALAWLAANDLLEIRIVVESNSQTGVPIVSDGYFHPKAGIFWDAAGDGIAYNGSNNETRTAWVNNYETFKVFTSWEDGKFFEPEVQRFDRLWTDAELGWRTVGLPQAVHDDLIRLSPPEPPPVDDRVLYQDTEAADHASWMAAFVRDAPYLVENGKYVGAETAALEPFPHQRAVAYDILERFPCNHLLADEVGLGKTIEAGLILRSLLISGRVQRCLILVPRSLARQWQQELADRFLVTAPFYDGRQYVWFDQSRNRLEQVPPDASPWEYYSVVIASSQMMKRQERSKELLAGPPWDLVMVDEAHHARRRDFLTDRDRPNRLLSLLRALKDHTDSLILITATPMQVDPVEVWDLLRLLGLPNEWGSAAGFVEYFRSTRLPYDEVDWDMVQPMIRATVMETGWGDLLSSMERELGPVGTAGVKRAVENRSPQAVKRLDEERRRWVQRLMRECHPAVSKVHRHTRDLLRQYHAQGVISQTIATRDPQEVWLEMSETERELYETVEQYISEYYNRYEEERRGLGFVMTIYRKRLTSGMYALGESLRRRLRFLRGEETPESGELQQGLLDEDLEDEDLNSDITEALDGRPQLPSEEIEEIVRILDLLERLPSEQKLEQVLRAINEELLQSDQIIVFTQYTDTMDSLRGHLRPTFGSQVGCYSGRGGEVWDPATQAWSGMSKERVQREFAAGSIKVLVCTDAAAEGLNLQNCGTVFNYDMPWNPMKVEQRIGRIDRIGQQRPTVRIRHFFYRETVEADVYAALGGRINWFETVVGDLQPILQVVHRTIHDAAMARGEKRDQILEQGIRQVRQAPDHSANPFSDLPAPPPPPRVRSPLTLADLTTVISESSASEWSPDGTFRPPREQGMFATNPALAESEDVTFCSYNTPAFGRIMALPEPHGRSNIVRLERVGSSKQVAYYGWSDGGWRPVRFLSELRSFLETAPPEHPPDTTQAISMFEDTARSARNRTR